MLLRGKKDDDENFRTLHDNESGEKKVWIYTSSLKFIWKKTLYIYPF